MTPCTTVFTVLVPCPRLWRTSALLSLRIIMRIMISIRTIDLQSPAVQRVILSRSSSCLRGLRSPRSCRDRSRLQSWDPDTLALSSAVINLWCHLGNADNIRAWIDDWCNRLETWDPSAATSACDRVIDGCLFGDAHPV